MVEKTKKNSRKINKKGSDKGIKKGLNKGIKKGSDKEIKKGSDKGIKKGLNKEIKQTNKIMRNLSRADIITNPSLMPKYLQDVITMPIIEKSIFDYTFDIKFSEYADYPKSSVGFQHFIHAMKNDAIKELQIFENKKKVYEVLNPFELSIDNYNESILDKGKKYFENKELSTDFYKLWEMLFMFDMINLESNFTSAHLGDDSDSNPFLESTKSYRNLFGNKNLIKNDKHYKIDNINEDVDFITVNYNINDINNFINTNEQDFYKDIIDYILIIIKNQKKDGTFVLKLTELYTSISIKLITIISSLYNRVYLCKPLTSRSSSSEKFIVAQGFKYSKSDSKLKDIITIMEKMQNKIKENKKLHISDIFSSYDIDPEMKVRMIQFNDLLENKQFKAIGQILTFIASQNFYGDLYQKSREEQILASKFWTDLFLMSASEYKQNKAKINDMSYLSNKINLEESLELKKKLII